jgi:uncharacterized protein (TIGR02996 family)
MPIWFVYRSPYHGPLSKYVKRLDGADTLLDWFRSIWRPITDQDARWQYAEELLGTETYTFGSLFLHIAEESWPVPNTVEDVHRALNSAFYIGGGEYRGTADTIQVATDDDEVGLALYWFTDSFAQAHPERVAYLLHDDWRLPGTVGKGGFKQKPGLGLLLPKTRSKKALYIIDMDPGSCGEIDDRCPAEKLPGRRLPELVPWLLGLTTEEVEAISCPPLSRLHEQLRPLLEQGEGLEASFRQSLAEDPTDTATWSAYSDWLMENDLPQAELHLLEQAARIEAAEDEHQPDSILLQVTPHSLALMLPQQGDNEYDQWFFFDDVWASGNVQLANALIDYGARWNVLDAWDVQSEYSPGIAAGEEIELKRE